MSSVDLAALREIRSQVGDLLEKGIIPFWDERATDQSEGGYLTDFGADGRCQNTAHDKYLVTQARMVWAFSMFAEHVGSGSLGDRLRDAARQGVGFLRENFWDPVHGGWRWSTRRDGSPLDSAKIMYGQTFAIYGLSAFSGVTGDEQALAWAEETFDLFQVAASDLVHGGYVENFSEDWRPEGTVKTLDTHLHLMEAYTALANVSGSHIHRRRLQEVVTLICTHLVDPVSGAGRNQTAADFTPQPPVPVARTWNVERADGQVAATDTTSYGHNLELIWLLGKAGEVLGSPIAPELRAKLGDHALRYGVDWQYGGVFREGPHSGTATDQDKEWWEQAEALVGLLDLYELTGNREALSAFVSVWNFCLQYLIDRDTGEWRTRVNRTGMPLDSTLGSVWKGPYHSGRSALETLARLDRIIETWESTSSTGES
ncbi:AGE family epimerase/isomerase [Streptomyces sp. NPDC058467]|uniref:AGE family epimerase/isomerase n=1 Tax=Streptomyces sp. NPDC058467 TaxID=3346513 RepID=UPI003656C32A